MFLDPDDLLRRLKAGGEIDRQTLLALEVACRAINERKPQDMAWHVAAAAQSAMPPGSSEYERALAAGMVLGFLSKLE